MPYPRLWYNQGGVTCILNEHRFSLESNWQAISSNSFFWCNAKIYSKSTNRDFITMILSIIQARLCKMVVRSVFIVSCPSSGAPLVLTKEEKVFISLQIWQDFVLKNELLCDFHIIIYFLITKLCSMPRTKNTWSTSDQKKRMRKHKDIKFK